MPPKRSLCVFRCENRDLVKHRCPNPEKHPETFKKWATIFRERLTILGRDPENLYDDKYIQYTRVCDRHFEKKYRTQYNRISSVAVPTLHLPKILGSVALKDHSYSKETEEGSESKTAEESNTTDVELRLISDRRKSMEAEYITPDIVGECNIDRDVSQISSASASSKDESKNKSTPVFSWEKGEDIVASDDLDNVECPTIGDDAGMAETPAEISLYDDDPSINIEEIENHAKYYCNECREDITGFRYTCVQCEGFDLCGACEARGAHDAHYVLRVPPHRPYNETKAVLATIREQLMKGNHFHDSDMGNNIKEEPQEEMETEYIDTDPDPLKEYISSVKQQDTTPRRKRRKSWESKLSTPPTKLPTLKYDDTRPIKIAKNTPGNYLFPVKLQIVSKFGKVHTKLKPIDPEEVPLKLKSRRIDSVVTKPSASPMLLRLPPGSNPAEAARALKTKVSVQLTPLEKQDLKWLPKYHSDIS